MNKSELIDAMVKESVLSRKDTEKALKAFTDTVKKQADPSACSNKW